MLDTTLVAWVGYAALFVILYGLTPVFIRSGARRTAPTIGALLYTAIIAFFLLQIVLLKGELVMPANFAPGKLLLLIGAGLAMGVACLCLFRALATGQVSRVSPMLSLSLVAGTAIGFFTRTSVFSLFSAIYLLLICLGILLMVTNALPYRDPAFLGFAAAAGVLYAVSEALIALLDGAIADSLARLIVYGIACLIALIFALIGRSFATLSKMSAESAIFSVSAGVAMGLALLSQYYSGLYGQWSGLTFISCAPLPVTIVLAAIFGREKISATNVFGLLLAIGGMAALALNA